MRLKQLYTDEELETYFLKRGKKLDDIREKIDLLKIDVQGYEYVIIQHGKEKVKNSLVIQLETSPIPLYKNEKTSSEVINQLEKLGFSLHMFNRVNTKSFKPMKINNNIYQGLHHLFQLDCVMINNFQNINSFSKEDLTKLILIMFYWLFENVENLMQN